MTRGIFFWRWALATLIIAAATFDHAAGEDLPTLEQLKTCNRQVDSAECFDKLFRAALVKHSTLEALQMLQRYEQQDSEIRRDCHPITHAIGRETFRLKGTIHESFTACDQTCHSGCYHGSVERFLRGDELYAQVAKHPSAAELKQKVAIACDPALPSRFRFQCLHGLGHALLYFTRYQLVPSLEACDALPNDWSQTSCYGGVFMENITNSAPELRDLSPTDFHYPCSKLAAKYRSECYMMQTSRMSEMGLSIDTMFDECATTGEFRFSCATSIGRDISNDVRIGRVGPSAAKCETAAAELRRACIRGVVYALIDNTWDGRYALPFCAAFKGDDDQGDCYRESVEYLKGTFDKPPNEIAKECTVLINRPTLCAELAKN